MAIIVKLEDLKDYLNMSGTSRDAGLTLLAEGINSFIVDWTGRDWQSATRNEVYSGSGTKVLMLRWYPITTMTLITEDGTTIDHTDTDEVEVDEVNGVLYRVPAKWTRSVEKIFNIQYTAGETAPDALKLAGLEMAAYMHRAQGGRIQTTVDAFSYTLSGRSMTDQPSIRSILDRYADSARDWIRYKDNS